ncbi:MAG: lysylphosphatidylglycerol synthase transmembrane domain-containing protein [Gemmatimonadota bacterium]|nr:lysylphosphatidylglycerol synthase transmembrane domain-containing protein [Gemmatimonadota bacterium]
MRKQFIVGIAISLILLVIVFWKTDRQALWQACMSANYWYVLPSVAVTFVCMWLRAVRWQLLFEPIKKISIHSLFSAVMIGFMANNLLPARLGEFVRAYVIARHEKVAKTASFGTIVVERLFDGLVLISFLIFGFLTSATLPDVIVYSGYVFGSIYAVTLCFLFMLVAKPDLALVLMEYVLHFASDTMAERVRSLIRSFMVGLESLRSITRILSVVFMSFLLWFIFALSIHYALLAFNLELPYMGSLLLMSILGFGVTIPSSPGYIGTFQASCVVGLALFSVSQSDALSFSIVFHASQYIPVTIVGLIYLWMDHLSLRDLRQAEMVS